MRLRVSQPSCEEQLLSALNAGYALARGISVDYDAKSDAGTFNREIDLPNYWQLLDDWLTSTHRTLLDVFPTALEGNLFVLRFSVSAAKYSDMDRDVGVLLIDRVPTYIERLNRILDVNVRRYGDLPLAERLYVEDIDSFAKVRNINPHMISTMLKAGRIELLEDEIQMGLEAILDVPFHRTDWGGEINDLYTANLVLNGKRRSTAFLLKGKGLRSAEMQISDCGKNGDQLIRLFQSPAQLFIIQYVGPISDAVIEDVRGKTLLRRSQGIDANFLMMDGQDTVRLLTAYGELPAPKAG